MHLPSAAVAAILLTLPLAAHAATLTTLVNFNGANGGDIGASLIIGTDGSLYGASYGGSAGFGSLFRYRDGALSTLISFNGANGALPRAGLTIDAAGNFYGTTSSGGASGRGTLFRLSAAGDLTTLHSFSGADGYSPGSTLTLDAAGNLYGSTVLGGSAGFGTLYRFNAADGLATLASFPGGSAFDFGNPNRNLAFPGGPLVRDAAGNLFGTSYGVMSPSTPGAIFKLDTAGTLAIVHVFDGPARGPLSGLVADSNGAMYGGTMFPGSVYRLDGTGVTTLGTLGNFSDQQSVRGALTLDAAGNIFGTTQTGGEFNRGTVFRLGVDGALTTLATFDGSNGSAPLAGLVADAAGTLYGTTSTGGADGRGTLFRIDGAGFVAPGGPPAVVPEPATWAMLIVGFGLVGGALRRRAHASQQASVSRG